MLDLQVTEVQHYTDKLFRFPYKRIDPSYRFTAGEFVMIGLDDVLIEHTVLQVDPYDDYLEFTVIARRFHLLVNCNM